APATPTLISATSLKLDRGASVRGQVSSGDKPVTGARVLLRAGPLPSTVGLTDARGGYTLWARGSDRFGVTVVPPATSGLPEANVAASDGPVVHPSTGVPLTLDFRFADVATTALALGVRTADDAVPSRPVRVRLEADGAALPEVGTLVIGGDRQVPASGFLRV